MCKALLIRDAVLYLFLFIFVWAFVFFCFFFCIFVSHVMHINIFQKNAQNTAFHLIVMKNTNTELLSWIVSKKLIEIKHLLLRNSVIYLFFVSLFFFTAEPSNNCLFFCIFMSHDTEPEQSYQRCVCSSCFTKR